MEVCPVGYYSRNGECKLCDISCTVCNAENYCTECRYDPLDPL